MHRPAVVLLENVRNIAGPRHKHEWDVIVRSLRELGYRVSSRPTVFSPHLLPPERGGRPQVRERVFIMATYVGVENSHVDIDPVVPHEPVDGWSPMAWDLHEDLPVQSDRRARQPASAQPHAGRADLGRGVERLRCDAPVGWRPATPGLPSVGGRVHPRGRPHDRGRHPGMEGELPPQERRVLHRSTRRSSRLWLERWDYLRDFPASRRKFEWQAQDARSLDDTIMHLRPSGLRAKKSTYVPALVAITQTSILGDRLRRISPREAARLQGLPEWFDFGGQPDAATYKQMGNGVNVGAAYYVFREHVLGAIQRRELKAPGLRDAVASSPISPDEPLERYWDASRDVIRRSRRTTVPGEVAG